MNYISIPYTGCLKRIQVAGKPSNLNCSTGDRYPRLICQCALRTLPARPTLKAVGPKSNDTQSTGLLIHEKDKRKSRLKSQDLVGGAAGTVALCREFGTLLKATLLLRPAGRHADTGRRGHRGRPKRISGTQWGGCPRMSRISREMSGMSGSI